MSDDAGFIFDQQSAQRIGNAVRVVERELGSSSGDELPAGAPSRERWRVKLTGDTRDGANWRWAYTGRPQYKSAGGHGGWSNSSRFSGDVTLYNNWEDDNTDTGFVSGYELDDGTNDTKITGIEPIRTGLVVDAWIERYRDGEGVIHTEWRFCVQNTPTVVCPE